MVAKGEGGISLSFLMSGGKGEGGKEKAPRGQKREMYLRKKGEGGHRPHSSERKDKNRSTRLRKKKTLYDRETKKASQAERWEEKILQ